MSTWGTGSRAGQNFINSGEALAAMDRRCSVAIDDIKRIDVLRISTSFQAQAEGMTNDDIINRLLKEIKEPDVPKFV